MSRFIFRENLCLPPSDLKSEHIGFSKPTEASTWPKMAKGGTKANFAWKINFSEMVYIDAVHHAEQLLQIRVFVKMAKNCIKSKVLIRTALEKCLGPPYGSKNFEVLGFQI